MKLISASEEARYVRALLDGDDRYIRRLYENYYPMVLQMVLTNSGTVDDAAELYQRSFIALYENVRAGRFAGESRLKTYLYAIARRLWLKELNQRGRFAGELQEEQVVDLSDQEADALEEREQAFIRMGETLVELGEPCATLLTRFYLESWTTTQIAREMGYANTDTVKTIKYKCLRRLRRLFFNDIDQTNASSA